MKTVVHVLSFYLFVPCVLNTRTHLSGMLCTFPGGSRVPDDGSRLLTKIHLCLPTVAVRQDCLVRNDVRIQSHQLSANFILSLLPSVLWLFLQEMKICSAIINLFHLIPAAPQTLVKPLLEVVMKTERAMLIEVGHQLHFLQSSGKFKGKLWWSKYSR